MDRALQRAVRSSAQPVFCAALTSLCLTALLTQGAVPVSDSAAAPVSQTPARLVFADPFPSPPEPLAPDLDLDARGSARQDALHHFLLGTLAEEQSEPEKAIEHYLKSLTLDPGNVPLAVQLASHFVQIGNPKEALRILKDAQQARPNDSIPPTEIARIYLTALHQPEIALSFAEKAYRLAPDQAATISIYVEVCSTAKLSQRLEDALRKTEALKVSDANFWVQIGDLFRNALALRNQNLPKQTKDRLNALFRRALDIAPNDARCLEKTADHFALSGQVPEAISFYERAKDVFRNENHSFSPAICLKLARAQLANEQINEAIETLEELLKEQPSIATAHETAAELYLQQGQYVSALVHFKASLDIDPGEAEDHLRVIQLELRLRRSTEAVELAEKACKLFPTDPNLHMLHAVALSELQRPAEAVEAFGRAEKLFERSQKEALNAEFYLTYGAAAERAGLIDKAASLLRKSIALNPENPEALNYLGYMWIDRDLNLDEAGLLIKKALELKPDQPAYLDSLGWWFFKKGDFQRAEKEIRKALERIRREDAGEVYEHLGDVLEKLNLGPEAISAWEAAIELNPKLDSVKKKIEGRRALEAAQSKPAPPPQEAPSLPSPEPAPTPAPPAPESTAPAAPVPTPQPTQTQDSPPS